jgi:hypothetical protein
VQSQIQAKKDADAATYDMAQSLVEAEQNIAEAKQKQRADVRAQMHKKPAQAAEGGGAGAADADDADPDADADDAVSPMKKFTHAPSAGSFVEHKKLYRTPDQVQRDDLRQRIVRFQQQEMGEARSWEIEKNTTDMLVIKFLDDERIHFTIHAQFVYDASKGPYPSHVHTAHMHLMRDKDKLALIQIELSGEERLFMIKWLMETKMQAPQKYGFLDKKATYVVGMKAERHVFEAFTKYVFQLMDHPIEPRHLFAASDADLHERKLRF